MKSISPWAKQIEKEVYTCSITSNARWTKVDDTQDTHHTVAGAESICRILIGDFRDYPCVVRGYCLEAWVEINGERQ